MHDISFLVEADSIDWKDVLVIQSNKSSNFFDNLFNNVVLDSWEFNDSAKHLLTIKLLFIYHFNFEKASDTSLSTAFEAFI